MASKIRTISKALRNSAVQRVLAWVLPIIFGWILSKLDTSPKKRK